MGKEKKTKTARFIFRKKSAILLETGQGIDLYRFSLPASSVEIGEDQTVELTEELIESGIPYGIPWQYKLGEVSISPSALAASLRRAGLWTAEDVFKHPDAVKGALIEAMSLSIADIVSIAKDFLYKES